MPTPGYVFKDGQPVPDDELAAQAQQAPHAPPPGAGPRDAAEAREDANSGADPAATRQTSATTTGEAVNTPASSKPSSRAGNGRDGEAPTESHALAQADHEEKGAAQEEHFEAEVRDLGWNEQPQEVPAPLVGGMQNEELWMLVRRFNKQMYHVKAIEDTPMAGLDLNIADEDEFSPDKLRANLERLYMTVIVGLMGFAKHVGRLRSWREPRRTGAFLAVYAVAWILDLVVPTLFATMILLIVFPPARSLMFPPAPLALVDAKTGGVKSPRAGVLGSTDSVTGAPEKNRGEAVEQEASNFVAGFATIAMSSATGKHEHNEPEHDPVASSVPDPTEIASASADAKSSAAGGIPSKKHDKTKQPMEEAMWSQMRPVMHILGDIADGWERFANALSPTSPFSKQIPRLKLAGLVLPGLLVGMVTSSYIFMKMTTFFVGFGFFGDPIIWRGLDLLNHEFPHWQKLLEIRNTILKGVPTNAQLTITLLRVGEANKAPIPPPPRSSEPPPDEPVELDHDEITNTLDTSHEELQDAVTADDTAESTGTDASSEKAKKRHGSRILGFLKGTTKAWIETKLGTDRARAVAGSAKARGHLGVLPKPKDQIQSGPIDFQARYKGKKGWVYISTSATVPCVSFSKTQSDGTGTQSAQDLDPVWSIPINEIQELKKLGGLGWKSKLVVGWAMGRNVLDGLEIVDKKENSKKLTAITLREELFNRLASMGGQKWESW